MMRKNLTRFALKRCAGTRRLGMCLWACVHRNGASIASANVFDDGGPSLQQPPSSQYDNGNSDCGDGGGGDGGQCVSIVPK